VPAGYATRAAVVPSVPVRPIASRVGGAELPRAGDTASPSPDRDLERLAALFLLFAVSGFALGAFFLSQSYKAMIFLNCGLVAGRFLGMREAGMPVPTHLLGMKLPLMFLTAIASVIALWVLLKFLL
jgi:hypothetical protein